MRRPLAFLLAVALGTAAANAQQQITFSAVVSGLLYTNSWSGGRGLMAGLNTPAGGRVFYVGLFMVSDVQGSNALSSVAPMIAATNHLTDNGKYIYGSYITPFPGGTKVWFQARAWSQGLGGRDDWPRIAACLCWPGLDPPPSYCSVVGRGEYCGESQIASAVFPGTGSYAIVGSTPGSRITSFDLYEVVPEPPAIAIGAVGLAGWLMMRRRKK